MGMRVKKKVSPKVLTDKFLELGSSNRFREWLTEAGGFSRIGEGVFSEVFSRGDVKYVVKIGSEYARIPRSKYILKPIRVAHCNEYDGILIQPKCEAVCGNDNDNEYWEKIVNVLRKKYRGWYDDHSGNVGIYKGQPVIIDW